MALQFFKTLFTTALFILFSTITWTRVVTVNFMIFIKIPDDILISGITISFRFLPLFLMHQIIWNQLYSFL